MACAAALAAAKEQVGLRQMALPWLQADLALWAKQLEGGKETRATIQKALQHWRQDPGLASLRDEAALANLPDTERQAWQKLWAEVAALLKQVQSKE